MKVTTETKKNKSVSNCIACGHQFEEDDFASGWATVENAKSQ